MALQKMTQDPPIKIPNKTARYLWLTLGWICFGIGALGVLLPGLPTTGPMLLALACFSKGSDRLHQWLLNHNLFGPTLRQWQEERTMPLRAKIIALLMMCGSLVLICTLSSLPPWGLAATLVLLLIGMGVVLCIPHRRKQP